MKYDRIDNRNMIINKEKLEKEVENIENMAIKRWFEDKSNSKIEILIGNYLDNYEFDRYNGLKIELAGLKG